MVTCILKKYRGEFQSACSIDSLACTAEKVSACIESEMRRDFTADKIKKVILSTFLSCDKGVRTGGPYGRRSVPVLMQPTEIRF